VHRVRGAAILIPFGVSIDTGTRRIAGRDVAGMTVGIDPDLFTENESSDGIARRPPS
jgi:hypothetical protein